MFMHLPQGVSWNSSAHTSRILFSKRKETISPSFLHYPQPFFFIFTVAIGTFVSVKTFCIFIVRAGQLVRRHVKCLFGTRYIKNIIYYLSRCLKTRHILMDTCFLMPLEVTSPVSFVIAKFASPNRSASRITRHCVL